MRSKTFRVLLSGLGAALVAVSAAQGKVTGVSASNAGSSEIEVLGSGLSKPQVSTTSGGKVVKLVFDGMLSGKAGYERVRAGGLRYVSYGWLSAKPPKVWVQFNFEKPAQTAVEQTSKGWALRWGEAAQASAQRATWIGGSASGKFPEKVPPLETVKTIRPSSSAEPTLVKGLFESQVSLDFINTEIVQVLKALALQAGVNIVTAPEVQGKITVSLHNVTVTQALDFVTSLAGLRYAKVGATFVVTASDRFAATLQQVANKKDMPSETRVITLLSGEGVQIKTSVLKAIPQDTAGGRYEIVLPSEKVTITTMERASTGSAPGAPTAAAPGAAQGSTQTAIEMTAGEAAAQDVKDPYLVVIGASDRLDEVERLVRDLDRKIVTAARLGVSADISTRVVPIYSAQASRIREAVQGYVNRDPNKESFRVLESSSADLGGDVTATMLIISGPSESMDTLEQFARSLDKGICELTGVFYPSSVEEATRHYEVVDLQFAEPLEVAFELQQRIRGLSASLLPAPADPLMGGGTYTRKPDSEKWAPQPGKGTRVTGERGTLSAGPGTGAPAQGGAAQGSSAGGDAGSSAVQTQSSGSSATRQLGYEPMRLLLRGTRQQLERAKELVRIMDAEPKRVAVEVRVMNLTKEDALRLGLDWSILTGGTVQALRVNQNLGATSSTAGSVTSQLGFSGGGSAEILGLLDKLAGTNKLIARPNLLAVNGKPASLFVGEKIQYVKTIQATQNGITIEVGELNVGVEMTVVPRIGEGGNIALDLAPSLTILKEFTPVPGGGNLPQTIERYAQSQAVLKSGDTIAIGGMIQEEDRKTLGGIPILMDLPIIGKLFSRTENRSVRTEVVFFLTVREVDQKTQTNAANPLDKDKKNAGG